MMTRSALLCLLLAWPVWARDPFSPVDVEQCPPGSPAPPDWRVQGIIGRPGHYEAWLISPMETRRHVRVNDRLSTSSWRVEQIDIRSVRLVDEAECQPPFTLNLKGARHVKEDRVASVAG